ncbi:MAG: DUF4040 domain-containing protein [Hyphomicrobiaceae bacterium]
MEAYVNALLLTLLAVVTITIIRQRSLFSVVILAGIYSFLMASVLMVLDAVDVAMTEAAVGAGISTVVLLAALHLTGSLEYPRKRPDFIPLFVVLSVGAALVWGTFSLPPFGTPDAPIHTHTSPEYIAQSKAHRIAPNIVTAVLGDYRAFDTLGEVVVVFTGGFGVMMLLSGRRRRKDKDSQNGGTA